MIVRVLLDTHQLLCALGAPPRLPTAARRLISDAEVFVSAASIWEISTKAVLGKLTAGPREVLATAGLRPGPFAGIKRGSFTQGRPLRLPRH